MNQIKSSDVFGFLIAAIIMGFIAWSVFFSDKSKSNPVTNTTQSTSNQAPTQQPALKDTTTVMPRQSPPVGSASTRSAPSESQLCSVRIINTLGGTDKTGRYKASMNDTLKTLTLTYVDNPNEILEFTYQGGNENRLRFYLDGKLQAEKLLYRKPELEANDKEIEYVSRTGEIEVTITYN